MEFDRDPEMPKLSPMTSRGRGRPVVTPPRVNMQFELPHASSQPPTLKSPMKTNQQASGTGSVRSNAPSSASRKRQAEIDGRKRIREVRQKYQTRISGKQDDIQLLLRNIVNTENQLTSIPEKDPEKMEHDHRQAWLDGQAKIKNCNDLIIWNREAIERMESDMKFEIDMIAEEIGDTKELIDLEFDDEQQLSSDDEAKVQDWNKKDELNNDMKIRQWQVSKQVNNETRELGPFDQYEQQYCVNTPINRSPPPPPPPSMQERNLMDNVSNPSNTNQVNEEGLVTAFAKALGETFGNMNRGSQVITKHVDKDLPYFGGRPEDWLLFKNEFERTNKKYNYDDSEKTVRLRKYLKGAAKDAVLHLLPNPQNSHRIMEILEERFGKPKHVLNALIEKVKQVPNPNINRPETIITFGTEVDALVTNIVAYKKTDYLNNIQLLKDLVDKLPPMMSSDWYRKILDGGTLNEDLLSFQKWIWKEVRIASERFTPEVHDDGTDQKPSRRRIGAGNIHVASSSKSSTCAICGKLNHNAANCYEFKRKNCEERWNLVKEKRLCFCCLSSQHYTRNCESLKSCDKEGCNMQHHELLHYQKRSGRIQNASTPPNEETPSETGTDEIENPMGTITAAVKVSSATLPMIPVVVRGNRCSTVIYALLDSGASVSMMEENIAKKVGLSGRKQAFRFTVFESEVKEEAESEVIQLNVSGDFPGARLYPMKDVHTVKRLGIPGINVDLDQLKASHPHLKRMQATGLRHGAPAMIIGYDHFELFSPRVYLESGHLPSAYRCKLGWYVREKHHGLNPFFGYMKMDEENDDYLHNAMKDFFSTESFGVKIVSDCHRSLEDKKALSKMEATTVKKDDRWETSLLWKNEDSSLPESYPNAFRRLKTMERKMDADTEFAEFCVKRFEEYKQKGYLVPKQTDCSKRKRWYLPWFFAYHPTKKPRLVFDGAAKCGKGQSLNDFLLKGPDLLRPLPEVLMRFRIYQIALTADIREMFHQVSLRKEDRPSQTVLFRGMNRETRPEELEMAVLFFGSSSSPCSAIFTKDRNADIFKEKYPEATEATHRDFYMDDFLGGRESAQDATLLREQLTEIHSHGGFELTKWSSNSEEVMSSIPLKLRAQQDVKFAEKTDFPTEKTLGLYWNPKMDEFQFNLSFEKIPDNVKNGSSWPTKRNLASITMSLFDPLGFLFPFKIKAMMILQDLWRAKIGWDDEIPSAANENWKLWMNDLEKVKNIRIPRKMTSTTIFGANSIQLHVFCDASKDAFSSVAYLRVETGEDVYVSFVFGKSRVAPLKELSIPRLELQAALMGARISKLIVATFNQHFNIDKKIFWTDSMTVLRWLRSVNGRFKEFVSNRVGEILDSTNSNEWRWIPTALNVADDATRLSKLTDFSSNSRWLIGPGFLKDPVEDWPMEYQITDCDEDENMEYRNAITVAIADTSKLDYSTDDRLNAGDSYLPDINKYSSWMKLIRATAARFVAVRKFKKSKPHHITIEDMDKAEKIWILKSQSESFGPDLDSLRKRNIVMKGSKLLMLSPALNEDGIIVLAGRIENAKTTVKIKRPPILDPRHYYTQLMVDWFHLKSGHFGQERVLNELRQHVWILDARSAVKKAWAKCLICRNRKVNPAPPEMGQLPYSRLESGKPPFYNTGIDYFGPFTIKQGRNHLKRWGVLFSCMTTRAVHLEIAETLDTSDMISALIRFINLRGKPVHIWSDNGTNFVGAEREIKESMMSWNQSEMESTLAVRGIDWHFIPPASPHMGGSWERLVGCVKKILYTLLREQNPKEVVLRTLFAEVVGILNSRPITYASVDPFDDECLTPNHLLNIPCVIGPTLPGEYFSTDKFRKSWRYCQDLAQNFWKQWSKNYLPWLAQREKWHVKQTPMVIGDVVILLDDNAPRNQWKKGIIVDVHPGGDGQVRAVTLKIAHVDPADKKKLVKYSILKRPVVKVCKIGESGESSLSREGEMSLLN